MLLDSRCIIALLASPSNPGMAFLPFQNLVRRFQVINRAERKGLEHVSVRVEFVDSSALILGLEGAGNFAYLKLDTPEHWNYQTFYQEFPCTYSPSSRELSRWIAGLYVLVETGQLD